MLALALGRARATGRQKAAMTTQLPDWVPPGVDTTRANPARVYDYLLGSTHNFPADQEAGRMLAGIEPDTPALVRANRAFLGRAVRFLAAQGIRQFLDIGSGIPAEGNVHEIVRQDAPGSRVVYVEVEPVAIAHSRAILAGEQNAAMVEADLRQPGRILAHADTRRLIDFGKPVGLLLCAVFHFIADDEEPWRIMAALRDALPGGSYLVLSQVCHDGTPDTANAARQAYNRRVSTSIHTRSRAEIRQFFDGFELVDPGLVYVSRWRPDSPGDALGRRADSGFLGGVGRKP